MHNEPRELATKKISVSSKISAGYPVTCNIHIHEDSSSTSMKFEPVVWRAIISIIEFIDDGNQSQVFFKDCSTPRYKRSPTLSTFQNSFFELKPTCFHTKMWPRTNVTCHWKCHSCNHKLITKQFIGYIQEHEACGRTIAHNKFKSYEKKYINEKWPTEVSLKTNKFNQIK